jgi:hypothetical protein
MILYLKDPKNSTRKVLYTINIASRRIQNHWLFYIPIANMLSKKSEKKITFKLSEKIPQNEPD